MSRTHALTAILPCNNLDASEAFYAKLGFTCHSRYDGYRILSDEKGGDLHLTAVAAGWLVPGRNPFGQPEHKLWGMYEFALNDPDQTLVRVGWPSDLKR